MLSFLLLLICILTQNVIAATTLKDKDVLEALKYFQSESKRGDNSDPDKSLATTATPLTTVLTTNTDLLTVIHELKPQFLHTPGVVDLNEDSKIPLLQSREVDDDLPGITRNITAGKRRFREWFEKTFAEDTDNLGTTSTRPSLAEPNRRLMSWIRNLFSKNTTPRMTPATSTSERTTQTRDAHPTLVLNKLMDVLGKLNNHLETQYAKESKESGYFVIKVPVKADAFRSFDKNSVRRKRSSNDSTTSTETPKTLRSVNNIVNATVHKADEKNSKGLKNAEDIRLKLISHLTESFNEIKTQISSLGNIKSSYSGEDSFRIGYIIACIDTLEANLNKLKKELEDNKNIWEENKLIELFEKLKISSDVVGNLVKSLTFYTNRNI